MLELLSLSPEGCGQVLDAADLEAARAALASDEPRVSHDELLVEYGLA